MLDSPVRELDDGSAILTPSQRKGLSAYHRDQGAFASKLVLRINTLNDWWAAEWESEHRRAEAHCAADVGVAEAEADAWRDRALYLGLGAAGTGLLVGVVLAIRAAVEAAQR